MQSPLSIVPLLLTALLSALLAFMLWQRRRSPGAGPLAVLMVGLAIWSLAYLGSLVATTLERQLFWANLTFLGIVLVPLNWLAFAVSYTGRGAWLTPRRIALLLPMPLLTLAMVWTNPLHGWFRTSVYQVPVGSFVVLEADLGPFFWIHTAYSYLLLLIGTILLIHHLFQMTAHARKQAGGLLLGVSAPWIGNVFYLSGLSPFPHLDLTPFALSISGVALSWDLLRFGLFELAPIAYSTVFRSMTDSVIVLDERGQIVDLNPAARALVHPQGTTVSGRPVAEVFPDQTAIITHFQDRREAHEELSFTMNGVAITVDLRMSPILDRNGALKGRVIVLHDITERKRAAAELQRRNDELAAVAAENARLYAAVQQELAERKQAQEALLLAKEVAEVANRAKSRFLGNMSHELRTPLTAILGYADLVEFELRTHGLHTLEADVAAIKTAGRHLLGLISDVLDLTRIEAEHLELRPERFVIAELAHAVAEAVLPLARKNGNTLHVECAPESDAMYGDRLRVRQALLNVLDNAAKFTANGQIELHVTVQAQAPLAAELSPPHDQAPVVLFTVRDTGIGIPPEHHLKLFQAFAQVDDSPTRKYGGSGLGLALSYRLCRLMGGDILVQSAPGEGSTFTVVLPLGQDA